MSKEENISNPDLSGQGTLYVVATPVGNLEDITYRAARILNEVQLIAAEDTRRAKILLARYGIKTHLTSFFSAAQKRQAPALVAHMLDGESLALITESGTPGLSDPGHYLVAKAVEAGIRVVPIPGPSAALAALMVSGLDSYAFTFYGFIPPKGGKRNRALNAIAALPHPVILYESPHRIRRTLEDLLARLGPRRVFIAREMTKLHEEFICTTLDKAIAHFSEIEPRGEFTLIIMNS